MPPTEVIFPVSINARSTDSDSTASLDLEDLTVHDLEVGSGVVKLAASQYIYSGGSDTAHRGALNLTALATTASTTQINTFLADPTSLKLKEAVTDSRGDGKLLFEGATRQILSNSVTNTSLQTPYPVFFDDFLNTNNLWANVDGTGSVAFNDSTAPLAFGIITVSSANATDSFYAYRQRNAGRIYNGGIIRSCFAIPNVTDIFMLIGTSNAGGAPSGLFYNTAVSPYFYFAGGNASVPLITTNIAPQAGNFTSGTRYMSEIERVSPTRTRVVIKSAPWNIANWTTIYDVTQPHAAVNTGVTNGCHISVRTLTEAVRSVMVDWYSLDLPAIR
jgi:hypothetical protein